MYFAAVNKEDEGMGFQKPGCVFPHTSLSFISVIPMHGDTHRGISGKEIILIQAAVSGQLPAGGPGLGKRAGQLIFFHVNRIFVNFFCLYKKCLREKGTYSQQCLFCCCLGNRGETLSIVGAPCFHLAGAFNSRPGNTNKGILILEE